MDLWLQTIDEVADRSINDHQKLQHELVQEARKSFSWHCEEWLDFTICEGELPE